MRNEKPTTSNQCSDLASQSVQSLLTKGKAGASFSSPVLSAAIMRSLMTVYSSASQQNAVQIERIDPNRLGKIVVERGGTRAFLKFIEYALGPGLANNTCWSEIIDQFIAPNANGALSAMQEQFQLSQKDKGIFYSVTSCENTPIQASRSVRIFSQDRDVDPIVDMCYHQFSSTLKPNKSKGARSKPKNFVELPEDMRANYGVGSFSYKK